MKQKAKRAPPKAQQSSRQQQAAGSSTAKDAMTPRQSKQPERLRRLVESGDHDESTTEGDEFTFGFTFEKRLSQEPDEEEQVDEEEQEEEEEENFDDDDEGAAPTAAHAELRKGYRAVRCSNRPSSDTHRQG